MAAAEAPTDGDRASLPGEARSWAPDPFDEAPHRLLPEARPRGASVFGPAGEKLGCVEALAIDEVTGTVAYAVVDEGGFLGVGRRRHPVPWSLLDYDPRKDGYVIPLGRPALEKAPALDRRALEGEDDRAFRERVQRYYEAYGATPYWT